MSLRRILAGTFLLASSLIAAPSTAQAQTVVPCDESALKSAISTANSVGGGQLVLTRGCTYTITTPDPDDPTTGLPHITTPITIVGNVSVITRSATAAPFRLFGVGAPNGSLTVNNVTIDNGVVQGSGGAILVDTGRTLTLNNSRVTNSSANGGIGGGILNLGSTSLVNTVLSGNHSTIIGGGMYNSFGASALFSNSRVEGNVSGSSGSGVSSDGSLTVNGGDVNNNTSSDGGGAIEDANGDTAINASALRGNSGGALNVGGGGVLKASSTTIAGNTSSLPGAGLRNNGGIVNFVGSSITGNTAGAAPGGIWNTGTVSLVNTSVAGNVPTNCTNSPSPVPGCTN